MVEEVRWMWRRRWRWQWQWQWQPVTCMIMRKVRMAKVTTIMITAINASIGDPVT